MTTPPEPETLAEALAARPLLERVSRLGDCIGAHTVGEITAISARAAAWLRENPPGQPVAIEPRGCPTPGACACVEPAPPAPEVGEVGEPVDSLECGDRMTYRVTPVAVNIHRHDQNFAFAEDSLELRLTDESAGAFFLLSQAGREPIRLELEELELLADEAKRLFSGVEVNND
jgi:hypothetical protein